MKNSLRTNEQPRKSWQTLVSFLSQMWFSHFSVLYTHSDTGRFMRTFSLVFLTCLRVMSLCYPGPSEVLTQQMWPEWNSGVRTSRQLKERVRSSDVICFSGIKDSSRALLHKLMRAFLRLLCSLERDYTGFNTDLPLFLCKTTQLPLWQDRGSGGGACPIVGGLWQVCEIGSKCDKLWSSA